MPSDLSAKKKPETVSLSTPFNCVGCGKCCTDHHVPLTLAEAGRWSASGGQLIVLLEAFFEQGPGLPEDQREHALRRSFAVPCGDSQIHLAVTFAAYNVGPCRNLDADYRCRIYTERPLVCRIYPMEINPHIPLRPEAKDCPPEAWQDGPLLIHRDQLQDTELATLIERSRQADREDIRAKVAICQQLGIDASALKGNGFTAYLPTVEAMAKAIREVDASADTGSAWRLHVADPLLAEHLRMLGAQVNSEPATYYSFIALQAG